MKAHAMGQHKMCPRRGNLEVRGSLARARTWQFILIGAYSLALSANQALCGTMAVSAQARGGKQANAQQTNEVSYLTQQRHQEYQSQLQRPQTMIAQASSVANMASSDSLRRQPTNVYHSIIDASDRRATSALAAPAYQGSSSPTAGDLNTAAGHHHGHSHGGYYEYRAVPKKKTWKFGYKRGNHKHTISRHEHGKAGKHPHFKTKVKWHDHKSKGKGIHLWDYNHHDKKHYHHG